MKTQQQTTLPLGVADPLVKGDEEQSPSGGGQKLLLSREECELTASGYFAHFTSKLIHSQANAIGVRVTGEYAKDIPYLCAARLLHDGTQLGLDYIAQSNAACGKKENSRNPHFLRVLERRRKELDGKELRGKEADPHPKDDYSNAEMYEEIARNLPGGEIGDGLCPRCKQLLLPKVLDEADWEDFSSISYVAATPLSSGWINSYFFERFYERIAEIKILTSDLEDLLKSKKETQDPSDQQALQEQIEQMRQALAQHARFRNLQALPWPVGGGNMQNVTGYYQRMAFARAPEVPRSEQVFFSVLYGNRVYGEWAADVVTAYLAWEKDYPESTRGDTLVLDEKITNFFLSGIRQACLRVQQDHSACTQATVFQHFLEKYRAGNVPNGVRPFYARLVFGDFSHDFCVGLATQLVNKVEPKLRPAVGLSEGLRAKLTGLFVAVIEEFF